MSTPDLTTLDMDALTIVDWVESAMVEYGPGVRRTCSAVGWLVGRAGDTLVLTSRYATAENGDELHPEVVTTIPLSAVTRISQIHDATPSKGDEDGEDDPIRGDDDRGPTWH